LSRRGTRISQTPTTAQDCERLGPAFFSTKKKRKNTGGRIDFGETSGATFSSQEGEGTRKTIHQSGATNGELVKVAQPESGGKKTGTMNLSLYAGTNRKGGTD